MSKSIDLHDLLWYNIYVIGVILHMPRAIVTPELAETLRSIRLQNKVQAKNLAAHIQKSAAYISKLENGNIRTIDTKELYRILEYISNENDSVELADQIYQSLKFKYSVKEIEEQLWFINYETVECLIPLPESLIDDINARIKRLNISQQYLNSRINANEALSKEERDDDSIEYNQWYRRKDQDNNATSIKIKLSEGKMEDILEKKYDVVPYVFIFAIMYYLLKIEKYGDTVPITFDDNIALMKKTTDELNAHKFFSISEKNHLIAQKQTKEEVQELLNSFDKDNIEIINNILSGLRFASEHNIKSTNEQLSQFEKNMHWDLGFMLKVVSMKYCDLKKISISNRKKLLSEIETLIKKYADIPDSQNQIEEY